MKLRLAITGRRVFVHLPVFLIQAYRIAWCMYDTTGLGLFIEKLLTHSFADLKTSLP